MQAVEFQATVKKSSIEIPPELRDSVGPRVRVIMLTEQQSSTAGNAIDDLLSHPVSIPGFTPLKRDEAHAR